MSLSLFTQSRQPFVVTDDEESSDNDSGRNTTKAQTSKEAPKVKEQLVGCDQTLRWAFSTVSAQQANSVQQKLNGVPLDRLEARRKKLRTSHWTDTRDQLIEEFNRLSSKNGSSNSKKKIKKIRKQIDDHKDEILDHIVDLAFKSIRDGTQESATPEGSLQAQRKRINHILRLLNRRATSYELLGVKQNASEAEIRKAWKNIITAIHPDQNKDKSAQECSQAVNAARDLLCDEKKRERYDAFLKEHPPPQSQGDFDEDFAPNAFGEESEDDDKDSEDDEEKQYPAPTKEVKSAHNTMKELVRGYFEEIEGRPNTTVLQLIQEANKKIKQDNKKHGRFPRTMYQVPPEMLVPLRFAQRQISKPPLSRTIPSRTT
ncbi:hypothetical protein F4808DRAFT_476127 [Astrocystis sublimbata]|nr:hypothetical protein F4808DRAFT_476127 [Astrocystis sublimbata]